MSNSLLIHVLLYMQGTVCEDFPKLWIFLSVHLWVLCTHGDNTHARPHTHRHVDRQRILAYGEALETANVTFALSLGALF